MSYHQFPAVAHSFASREKIPAVSSSGERGMTSSSTTAPCEGRLPNTPFTPAGPRMDPPVSLPTAKSSHGYAATAVPDPVDELLPSWYPSPRGLYGAWRSTQSSVAVSPFANCDVFDFPTSTIPPSSRR